jgi:hypothetical protein
VLGILQISQRWLCLRVIAWFSSMLLMESCLAS